MEINVKSHILTTYSLLYVHDIQKVLAVTNDLCISRRTNHRDIIFSAGYFCLFPTELYLLQL